MRIKNIVLILALALHSFSALAFDWLNTQPATKLFTFGGRIGVNASNRTMAGDAFNAWNVNSWGAGFDIGAVANINIRDYIAVQPGFFFESRSGNYSYATDYLTNTSIEDTFYQLGHLRSYNFTVPVLAELRLSVLDNFKWLIDFGPYFQFRLHSTDGDNILVPYRKPNATLYDKKVAETSFFDLGLKMGTGFMLFDHYYFGIHYMAGMLKAWKYPDGGKNKAWTFTIGYDF